MKQKGLSIILPVIDMVLSLTCSLPVTNPSLPQSALSTVQSIIPTIQPSMVEVPPAAMTQLVANLEPGSHQG